jgi:anti-anti-sigma factor
MKPLDSFQRDNVSVLCLREDLDQHDWLEMRQYVATNFLEAGRACLILDCEACAELPSIAFGVFCSLSRDAQRLGGGLRLIHVSPAVRAIMAQTHVDQRVRVCATLAEAADELTSDPEPA